MGSLSTDTIRKPLGVITEEKKLYFPKNCNNLPVSAQFPGSKGKCGSYKGLFSPSFSGAVPGGASGCRWHLSLGWNQAPGSHPGRRAAALSLATLRQPLTLLLPPQPCTGSLPFSSICTVLLTFPFRWYLWQYRDWHNRIKPQNRTHV